ncbi:MAG: hypothetical protein MRY83_08385 [Flavobacteriales bacterium]|nr:hypothetical protein [Flavobacteriales bacterium]
MPSEKKKCSICATEIEGKFCHGCGQKIGDKPLNAFHLISDAFNNLLSLDRSIFGLIKHLFSDPYFIINNYRQGNSRYFLSPSRLTILFLIIAGLYSYFYSEYAVLGFYGKIKINGIMIKVEYFFLLILYSILILSGLIAYFRFKKGLVFHLIASSYIFGSTALVFIIISWILKDLLNLGIDYEFIPFMIICALQYTRVFAKESLKLKLIMTPIHIFVMGVLFAIYMLSIYYLLDGINLKLPGFG